MGRDWPFLIKSLKRFLIFLNESVSGMKGPMDWIWNTVFQCAQRICTVFEGKVPGKVITFAQES